MVAAASGCGEAGQDRGEDQRTNVHVLCQGFVHVVVMGCRVWEFWGEERKEFNPLWNKTVRKCCSKGVRTWPWGTNVTLASSGKGIDLWLFAASFSRPLVRREEAADRGNDTSFYCHSAGGFPEPRVHWLINQTAEPPEGSVRTVAALLPDSYLYNITSYLKVNISKALSVSCGVENALLNETFTSTSCEWQIL